MNTDYEIVYILGMGVVGGGFILFWGNDVEISWCAIAKNVS